MTEEIGNGGAVKSLASICARAIFRSKADVWWSQTYKLPTYRPSEVLCQTVKFERFVRALTLPKTLEDCLMSYPERNCNTGCRSKKIKLLTHFNINHRWIKWRWTLNQPGCDFASRCDCCTCDHDTSCHCMHCGQSSSDAFGPDSGEDPEDDEDWFFDVGESDGWESSDHSEGACTNSKCDAYSPCKDCTKNTDDEDAEEQDDSTDGEEEEQDDSTDGEEQEEKDDSTDCEEQEEKDGNNDD